MDTTNVYGYNFKQRCIAVFLVYTADPKVKYLSEKQLNSLSKNLWVVCKKEFKGKLKKDDVIFNIKDVDDLVLANTTNGLFKKIDNKYMVLNWSVYGESVSLFEKRFLSGRLPKEAKITKIAWDLTFNKNQNQNN